MEVMIVTRAGSPAGWLSAPASFRLALRVWHVSCYVCILVAFLAAAQAFGLLLGALGFPGLQRFSDMGGGSILPLMLVLVALWWPLGVTLPRYSLALMGEIRAGEVPHVWRGAWSLAVLAFLCFGWGWFSGSEGFGIGGWWLAAAATLPLVALAALLKPSSRWYVERNGPQ